VLYSYKGLQPQPLGKEIILSDGTIRTSSEGFTHQDLIDAGYVKVDKPPEYNKFTETLIWDRETFSWVVEEKTQEEKNRLTGRLVSEWGNVRRKRNALLEETDIEALKQIEMQGTTSDELKSYRQALRDVPQNFTNPSRIDWPSKPGRS
jgi:hypothetical protein